MRDLGGAPADMLAGAFRWRPVVSAWKGTALLAAPVPIVSGEYTTDATQEVPERVTFTVPEWAATEQHPDGYSWVPDGPTHPLAHYGQFVEVDIHVWSTVTAADELAEPTAIVRLGRFQVQDWEHDDLAGTVRVECVGLLQRVADARLRNAVAPHPSGTFTSEFRRLMVPGMPVQFDATVTDREIPKSFVWDEDRLAALYEIADAWPARLRVDQYGTLRVLPPLPDVPTPVLEWEDGVRGTLISAPTAGTRDGVYNVVVARSSATDDPARPPAQAVAVVARGPLRPAEYGEVTLFWSSPLATSLAQLQASADTILARRTRPAVVQRVAAVPDPRVEADDPVGLTRDGIRRVGYVIAVRLPLVVESGSSQPMTMQVGVVD